MRKSALLRAAAALAVVLWAMPASAQELRGAMEGTVRDSSGGVLPGVTVQAKNVATNAAQSAVSDANGIYRFPALQPGTYEITATLSGFVPAKVSGQLLLGQLLKVDMIMNIAGLAEDVYVRGDTPIIDVKQNAVTATITADVLDLIPKGRNFLSAITGVAGTGSETRGGLTIDGAAAAEHRYVIDGLDTTNLRTGVSARDVVVDFLEQIQVKQSGYNAEYRAATGGVVSAITKSGTNVFHGDIGTYYEGGKIEGLLGNPRPQLRLNPSNQALAEYFTAPRVNETTEYDTVGSIGGPILKSRAWFFLGVNLVKEDTIRAVTWTSAGTDRTINYNGQTQTFDQRPRDKSFQYNGAMQLGSSMRVRFSGSNFRRDGGTDLPGIDNNQRDASGNLILLDANGNRFSSTNPTLFNPRATRYTYSYENTYSATLDWTLGNRSYVNFTGGYYFDGSGTRGGDYFHGVRRSFSTSNIGLLDVPAELQQLASFTDNPVNTFNFLDDYSRVFVNADMTVFKDWKGQHAIKFGTQIERLGNQVNTGAQFPNVTLQWNSSRSTLDQRNVRGTYGYYQIVRSYTIGDVTANNFGVFVQDQWTPSSRMTLNYGVRAERTYIPSFTPGFVDLTFGWSQQIAPRIGFAYDVHGDGKLKMYSSWGVFFDTPKLEMPRGLWGADHILNYYYTLDTYDWPSINCDGPPGSGCPGTFIEQVDSRHPANDPNNNLIDRDLKPVQTREFTLGLDRELNRVMSVGVRYVHKWFIRTIEDTGVQVPGVGEIFYITNPGYGLGAYPLGQEYPRTPFPKRVYDGIDLTFRRRLSNNWFLTTSVLVSRLWGNYSGLTSTDEGSRNSPNVNRFFDGLYMSFDSKGNTVYGRLQNDRPFQFKAQAGYIMPWGTQIGVNFFAASGYLNSSTVSYKSVPVFYNGRGDLGRSPTYHQTDLNFTHRFRLPRKLRADVQFNIDNLFDTMTWTTLATTPYRDALTLPRVCRSATDIGCDDAFFNGFVLATAMAARVDTQGRPSPGRVNKTYNLPSGFQSARTARVMVKFVF
ncbi:MAG TPA: TonB-dependent receptor [Vicinamibacterales bacterium]|nr:TonB-dependent receptor [Vicinamibacterales bacterium]